MPHPRVHYTPMSSGADPLDLHLAHIRHLSCPSSLASVLKEKFSRTGTQAKSDAIEIAPFIEQALGFLASARTSPPNISPVPLYYAYLNLAVAIVRAYKPNNWESYKSHGAADRTKNLTRISLSSKLAKVQQGAIPLFHSVISNAPLTQRDYCLRELVCAIPELTGELNEIYNIRTSQLFISGRVAQLEEEGTKVHRSELTFEFLNQHVKSFPIQRLHKICPFLKSDYTPYQAESGKRVCRSNQAWSAGNRERAKKKHEEDLFFASNYGSHEFDEHDVHPRWVVPPSDPILPTLTASLLLLFSLSALCRYRANALNRVASSKLNLLLEVFQAEVDAILLPAFRNLLYCESLTVARYKYL